MDPASVRSALGRILDSPPFRSSRRMQRFLEFTVAETLAGRGEGLKETVVGTAVFDRPEGYDTRLDGIVRVEARRLRAKLREYYERHGAGDSTRIDYPPGCYQPQFAGAVEEARPTRTVAVLPFTSMGAPADAEFFADGLAQELIYLLARIPSLRVIAWNSVNKLRDLPNARQMLPVDSVLEGSVRHSGVRVRINITLLDAATGEVQWAEVFDREMADLFTIQEDLARAIASGLRVRVVGTGAAGASAEAYALYLRGRHQWGHRTEQGLRASVDLFEQAVLQAPDFALAHAGLADAHSILCDFGHEPPGTAMARARVSAQRALALDSTLAEAHNSLGFIVSMHDWNWDLGETFYRRALELRPSYSTAHHWYGCDLLALHARWEEAEREMAAAAALDPLEPSVVESVGYILLLARRYSEAERFYVELQRRWPGFWKCHTGMGRVLSAQGRHKQAAEHLERSRPLLGDSAAVTAALAHVRGRQGDKAAARHHFDDLQRLASTRHVSCVTLAIAHLGVGDSDSALACLERAAESKELALAAIAVHPAYDELRGKPRFQRLLERLGLA